ncbi:MAG: imidazole glycerol phosphate synthase subunit HisH [Nitrospirota bacterium]
MIAIIDYGMGNLRSVQKGFEHVGVQVRVVSDARSVQDAAGIVLPGVGAFPDCMRNLDELGLIAPILRSIQKGKPYLGICLGLQVLFTESKEFGRSRGLDVFKGSVPRFPRSGLKIPHMGWNQIDIKQRPPIFADIPDRGFFYFVHSYYVAPEDPGIVAATTDYGISFTSMVWKDNVVATQFHPEKSQKLGLQVLKGFGDCVRSHQ